MSLDSDREKTSHKATSMPRCVLNEKCLFPNLELRVGHKCPICLGSVHVFCGVEDPECSDMHLNVTCNACVASLDQLPLQAEKTDTRKEPPKEKTKDARKEPPKEKSKDTRKEAPKKKGSTANKKHHQAAELVPTKLKKTAAALSFRLAATTGKQDPLIMKSVCFLADDGAYGTKLAEHFGGVGKIEKSLSSIDGNLYLFGNIVRASKLPKKGNEMWLHMMCSGMTSF